MTKQEASIHKEAILAFLNGAEIEMKQPDGTCWTTTDNPGWLPDWHYRVRQEMVEVGVEDLIDHCVKFGGWCDAQEIADAIRAYCKERGAK
jgi:hypothetical protein